MVADEQAAAVADSLAVSCLPLAACLRIDFAVRPSCCQTGSLVGMESPSSLMAPVGPSSSDWAVVASLASPFAMETVAVVAC